ncbi:MAG: hypothetical protein IT176_03920 [Acidobacteria bacterium]|nr:hypothetical protein [Acidobacteriota bacterium]
MRLTFNALDDGLAAIDAAAGQLQTAQWQVSTGRRIRVPSDDPAAAQAAVVLQSEIGTLDAYTRSGDTADAHLAALDTTLGDIVDKLTQALSVATGARGDTPDQPSRDAASATLAGIRDALADNVNSRFDGGYLFAGTQSTTAPYAKVGGVWTYQADSTPMLVEVARDRTVAFTMDGQAIFQGSDPADVLTTLDGLVAAVATGDNVAIGAGIDALQRAFSRAVRAQSQVGADQTTLADCRQRVHALGRDAAARLSSAQDANLADAITRMRQADTTYRAALGAVAASEKVSLLDYLR